MNDSGIQLKTLGIVGNIRHCGAFWGLKCNLAGVIFQTTLVVALLYLFLIIFFFNTLQRNFNSKTLKDEYVLGPF